MATLISAERLLKHSDDNPVVLEEVSKTLPDIYSQYNEVASTLEDTEENEQWLDDFMKRYATIVTKVKSAARISATSPTPSTATSATIRTPEIKIKSFGGEFQEWQSFYDIFEAVIHQNDTIPDAQKLMHLKNALTGPALQKIENIPISNSNYNIAYKRLIDFYHNTRALVQSQIQYIMHLPSANRNICDDTQQLLDNVINAVEQLRALGRPVSGYDDFLIEIVIEKTHQSIREDWERRYARTLPTFEELTTFLADKCSSLQALQRSQQQGIRMIATSEERSAPKTNQCSMRCNEVHPLHKCPKYLRLDVKDRNNLVKTKKLCINCLSANHTTVNCHSRNCQQCSGRHHTSLHYITRAVNTSISTSAQSILPTCLVKVRDCDGFIHQIRALLDSGSETNIITSQCAKRLKLPLQHCNVAITGVGNKNSRAAQSVSFELFTSHSDYQARVDAIVMDHIVAPIPSSTMSFSNIALPEYINLADPRFNEAKSVDLIIGAELFFNILRGRSLPIPGTSIRLRDTALGWVATGSYLASNASLQRSESRAAYSAFRERQQIIPYSTYNATALPVRKRRHFRCINCSSKYLPY